MLKSYYTLLGLRLHKKKPGRATSLQWASGEAVYGESRRNIVLQIQLESPEVGCSSLWNIFFFPPTPTLVYLCIISFILFKISFILFKWSSSKKFPPLFFFFSFFKLRGTAGTQPLVGKSTGRGRVLAPFSHIIHSGAVRSQCTLIAVISPFGF